MRFSLLLCVLLAGCGVNHVQPSPPHNVYCLTPAQYKALVDAQPKKIGNTLDPDARVSNKQLVTQNVLVRTYGNNLLDVLGGCVG